VGAIRTERSFAKDGWDTGAHAARARVCNILDIDAMAAAGARAAPVRPIRAAWRDKHA